MAETAFRPEFFHQLFKRQILVGVGAQCRLLHAAQQIFELQLGRHLGAQHQSVGEESDQAFDLGSVTVSNRRAEHDVFLSAVPRQKRLKPGQQGHK